MIVIRLIAHTDRWVESFREIGTVLFFAQSNRENLIVYALKNMDRIRNFKLNFILQTLVSGILLLGCSDHKKEMAPLQNTTMISGTVAFTNIGARAFLFTAVTGSGISTDLNVENAPLTLKIGSRYQFINNAGAGHPFQILGSDSKILLSQNDVEGTFEKDNQVNYQVDGMNITFTLTQNLADQIAPYICGNHSSMSGRINAVN